MLYGHIERELTQGEPWFPWQQTEVLNERSHLMEPEQRAVDICNEVLQNHIEHLKKSKSNGLRTTRIKPSSLYQLISQYLCLTVVKR